jgi:hypothetical protein
MKPEQGLVRKGIIAVAAALAFGGVSPALAMPLGGDAATGLVPLVEAEAQATPPATATAAPSEAAVPSREAALLSSEVASLTQRVSDVERQLDLVERELQSSHR